MKAFSVTGSFISLVLALGLGSASADDTVVGKRQQRVFGPDSRIDNLLVHSGAKATLNGTRVKGNIKVQSGGQLCLQGARVIGNVQAERAAGILVNGGTSIGGNLQVKQSYGKVKVCASVIKGDLQLEENRLDSIVVLDNDVWEDIQLFKNRVAGGIAVKQNDVGGNIQLQENDALRIDVKLNDVHGDMQLFKNYVDERICIVENRIGGNLQCKENDPDPVHRNNEVEGDTECDD
jgi:hypothetical protein